jgi:hypothetical protein
MIYYNQQLKNLGIIKDEENYLKIQLTSANGKTNWMTITEDQAYKIIDVLDVVMPKENIS